MNIKRLLKQENTGMWWGGFKAIISSASSYASWASLAMQALTLYYVSKSGIPIWVFASIVGSFALTVMGFEWKISIPSGVRFSNSQMWKHDNPMRIAIEKCLENDKALLENDNVLMEQNKKIMDKLNIDSKEPL